MRRTRGQFPALIAALIIALGCVGGDSGMSDSSQSRPKIEKVEFTVLDSDSTRGARESDAVEDRSGAADDTLSPAAVVRDYYRSISDRNYARAYALWSDSGRASGQSLDEFQRGFARTASVTATIGAPGRIEGAAGSRYVEIPVSVEAHQRDGGIERYRGTYTLRRAVVPGASDAQRSWHLYSAKLARID